MVNSSPSVALNRLYALYKVTGPQVALTEAEKLKLADNHHYFMLLGALYEGINPEKAASSYWQAYNLARTPVERQHIQQKIDKLPRQ